jgi:hypothetical protein
MLSTALSKILAAKALAAVVLLAGATGGVALAATVSDAPSSPATDESSEIAPSTATSAPSDDPESDTDETAAADADSDASSHPSIVGLCNAWAAGATDNPGAAADNPAYGSLIEAAGSVEDVPGFCAVRERTDQPGKTGNEDDDPDAATTDGPGNAGRGTPPTAAPGNPDHPAGPPANRAERDDDPKNDDPKNDDPKNEKAQDDKTQDSDPKDGDNRTEPEGQVRGGGGAAEADRRPNS